MTSITHSGAPVALSWDWTNFSPVEASKFRTGSNAPAAYAPDGEHRAELHRDGTLKRHGSSCVEVYFHLTYQVQSPS